MALTRYSVDCTRAAKRRIEHHLSPKPTAPNPLYLPTGLLGEGGAFAKTFSFSDLAALEAPLQLANDGGAGALPQLEPLPRNFSLSDMGHFEGI